MRERLRNYELMFIISPLRSNEEEINATIGRVTNAISAIGGEVTAINHTAPWGRRKFAYPIREYAEGEASRRAFTEGYYVLCHFTMPASQVTELERTLKLTDAVLRYLLTLVETRGQPAPVLSAGGSEAAHASAPFDDDEDALEVEEIDEDEA